MMIFFSNKSVQLFEYKTGMFVFEFDFSDTKQIGGQGLAVINRCNHWMDEAKDKKGGNYKYKQFDTMFKDAGSCPKCGM